MKWKRLNFQNKFKELKDKKTTSWEEPIWCVAYAGKSNIHNAKIAYVITSTIKI